MKKSAIIIITLLALCLSSCNPELPPASSVPSSDATSSDVDPDDELYFEWDDTDELQEKTVLLMQSLLDKNDLARFVKRFGALNTGVEKRFEIDENALGGLVITNPKVEYVSLGERNYSEMPSMGEDVKIIKTKMLGTPYDFDYAYKITFTVINSGKTDLPLGEVTIYTKSKISKETVYSSGGRMDTDGFIDYIDGFVTEENEKYIDFRYWPVSQLGDCLNLLYQKYGVVEFDGFENVDISMAVMPLPASEIYENISYYTEEETAEAVALANRNIEAVFGVADYVSAERDADGFFYSKDGKLLKSVYMSENDWCYGPAYKVFENGLAMTGFEKDGDTVRVTYTSFYDTLGFFENYRYCLTFKETDVKDRYGVPYLRIVSGHFVND